MEKFRLLLTWIKTSYYNNHQAMQSMKYNSQESAGIDDIKLKNTDCDLRGRGVRWLDLECARELPLTNLNLFLLRFFTLRPRIWLMSSSASATEPVSATTETASTVKANIQLNCTVVYHLSTSTYCIYKICSNWKYLARQMGRQTLRPALLGADLKMSLSLAHC